MTNSMMKKTIFSTFGKFKCVSFTDFVKTRHKILNQIE